MKIEVGAWGNCSESVFRFMTLDPRQIQFILQAIADEINANTDFKPHQNQKIPLYKTAEEYDTKYKKNEMSYSGSVREKYDKQIKEKISKEVYPKTLLKACAGLGDNEAIITIEKKKKAFRLNIGNNDISANKTDWIDKVMNLGIKVQEAEFSKELQEFARDCTCNEIFFESYENLIKDEEK
jgi:hypothetical protein